MGQAAEQLQAAAELLSQWDDEVALAKLNEAFATAREEGDADDFAEVERMAMAIAERSRGNQRDAAAALARDARGARQHVAIADSAVHGGVIGPALVIAAIACMLLIIGSFGPWAKAFALSVSGTDGSNDGWVTLVAAVLGLLAVWRRYASGLRGAGLGMTVAAGLGLATSIYDRNHIQHVSSQSLNLISVGWGLNLTLAASVVLGLCGLRFLFGAEDIRVEPTAALAQTALPAQAHAPRSSAARFAELSELRQKGLISDEEYETKRAALLAEV